MYTVIQIMSDSEVPPRWLFAEFCKEKGIVEHEHLINGVSLLPEDFYFLHNLLGISNQSILTKEELLTLHQKLLGIFEKKQEMLKDRPDNQSLIDEIISIQSFLLHNMWDALEEP